MRDITYPTGYDVDTDEYRRALRSLLNGLGSKGDVLLQETDLSVNCRADDMTEVTISLTVIPSEERSPEVVQLQELLLNQYEEERE